VVAAALRAGNRPQAVFVREEAAEALCARLGLDPASVFVVSERVAARISSLETPADVAAVLPLPPRRPLASLLAPASRLETAAPSRAAGQPPSRRDVLVVYVDGVQDPGNLGTLLRAAVAFGASAVATSAGCADLYGSKTVRASMGALFALETFPEVPLAEVASQLPAATVYGLSAHDGAPIGAAALRLPAVLVVGAERAGISRAALAHVGELVTIPLSPLAAGAVESLNAGVAGAIALYEFSRRSAGASEDPSRRTAAAQEG
jgi:TrmH family RNA methyltransferase